MTRKEAIQILKEKYTLNYSEEILIKDCYKNFTNNEAAGLNEIINNNDFLDMVINEGLLEE